MRADMSVPSKRASIPSCLEGRVRSARSEGNGKRGRAMFSRMSRGRDSFDPGRRQRPRKSRRRLARPVTPTDGKRQTESRTRDDFERGGRGSKKDGAGIVRRRPIAMSSNASKPLDDRSECDVQTELECVQIVRSPEVVGAAIAESEVRPGIAEVDVEILGLERQSVGEGVLATNAGGPAPKGIARRRGIDPGGGLPKSPKPTSW